MLKAAASWSRRAGLRLWEAAPAMWHGQDAHRTAAEHGDLEAVRTAMRGLLEGESSDARLRLRRSIAVARDLRTLWYLRSALMQVVAAEHGEGEARRALEAVDGLFRAGWPEAPVSRPAELG